MPITSLLILLTQRGLLERVQQFLSEHDNQHDNNTTDRSSIVNVTDQNGWTALHHAALKNRVEIARLFVERGSCVHAPVQRQDQAAANTNNNNNNNSTRTMFVDKESSDGATPLHLACRGGAMEMMRELMQRGADIQARDAAGRTPLVYACEWGQLAVVKELLTRMTTTTTTTTTTTREFSGRDDNDDKEKPDLLATLSNDGSTPLHWTGYMRGCRFRDMFGARESSPHSQVVCFLLEHLLQQQHSKQENAKKSTDEDDHGQIDETNTVSAWINAVNEKGETALHVACRHGSPSVVKALLRHSAAAHLQNHQGETALHLACWKTHLTIVQDLLRHNASHATCSHSDGNIPQDPAKVLNLTTFENGETALHYAVKSGRVSVVKALLGQPMLDINAGDRTLNETALHATCRTGNLAVVQALLSNAPSLNVHALNTRCETPLMVTASIASSGTPSQARQRSTDILLMLVLHIVSLQGCVVEENPPESPVVGGNEDCAQSTAHVDRMTERSNKHLLQTTETQELPSSKRRRWE